MHVRNADPHTRSVNAHFVENVTKLGEVVKYLDADKELLCIIDNLKHMKVHKHIQPAS